MICEVRFAHFITGFSGIFFVPKKGVIVYKPLINYIKNNLSAGYSKDSIRYVLRRSGYMDEDIENAFDYIEEKREHKRWVAPVIAIIVIAIVAANAWYFKPFGIFSFGETTETEQLPLQETQEAEKETSETEQTTPTTPASEMPLTVNPISVSVKTGQSSSISVNLINNLDDHNFRLEVSGLEKTPEAVGMTYDSSTILVENKKTKEWTINIAPAEGSGAYVFNAKVSCTDCEETIKYKRDFIVIIG